MKKFLFAILLALAPFGAYAQQMLGGSNGAGVLPPNSLGNESQWFMDFSTGRVYGPKSFGLWPAAPVTQFLIQGTAVPAGPFYVAKTGSDTYDCLSATVTATSGPCLTVNQAVATAMKYDSGGQSIVINIAAGTYTENIFINGPLRGSTNNSAYPIIPNGYGSVELILSGASAATTTLAGASGLCATVASSVYANVGLRNIKVTGTGTGCQSSIFAQVGGTIQIHEGVEFGAASQAIFHVENTGSSIQVWNDYTVSGSASSFIAAGQGAMYLQSVGTGTFTGTPAFATSFIYAYAGAIIQWNVATPFSGAATGSQFILRNNAVIETNGVTGVAQIPGSTLGYVSSGGQFHGPAAATLLSDSGFGTTGSVAVAAKSTPRSGFITISPGGAGIPSDGIINVAFPYAVVSSTSLPGVCFAQPTQDGTGAWSFATTRAAYKNSTPTQDYIAISVSNNGVAFTGGQTYTLSYMCTGD